MTYDDMTYHMTYDDILHYIRHFIWHDMMWHDIWCDMIYDMTYDMTCNMTWYMTFHMTLHITWYMTWHMTYEMTHDMTWHITCILMTFLCKAWTLFLCFVLIFKNSCVCVPTPREGTPILGHCRAVSLWWPLVYEIFYWAGSLFYTSSPSD